MPKFKLSGDILHPGFVIIEATTIEEAIEKAENGEAKVYDEQQGELGFVFDGPAWTVDDSGKETEVA